MSDLEKYEIHVSFMLAELQRIKNIPVWYNVLSFHLLVIFQLCLHTETNRLIQRSKITSRVLQLYTFVNQNKQCFLMSIDSSQSQS